MNKGKTLCMKEKKIRKKQIKKLKKKCKKYCMKEWKEEDWKTGEEKRKYWQVQLLCGVEMRKILWSVFNEASMNTLQIPWQMFDS